MKLTREHFMGWALHVATLELASYRECSFDDSLDFIVAEALAAGLETESDNAEQASKDMVHHFNCVVEGNTGVLAAHKVAESGEKLTEKQAEFVLFTLAGVMATIARKDKKGMQELLITALYDTKKTLERLGDEHKNMSLKGLRDLINYCCPP